MELPTGAGRWRKVLWAMLVALTTQLTQPARAEPGTPVDVRAAPARPPLWQPILGGSAVAVGAGLWVGSWVLYRHHRDDGQSYLQAPAGSLAARNAERNWDDSRPHPFSLVAAGTVALTGGAIGLAFAYGRDRLPLWAYLSSVGVGAGLFAAGVVEVAKGDTCNLGDAVNRQSCVLGQEQRDRGALLLINAFPFLVAPAFHALWKRSRGSAPQWSVASSAGHGRYLLQFALRL